MDFQLYRYVATRSLVEIILPVSIDYSLKSDYYQSLVNQIRLNRDLDHVFLSQKMCNKSFFVTFFVCSNFSNLNILSVETLCSDCFLQVVEQNRLIGSVGDRFSSIE